MEHHTKNKQVRAALLKYLSFLVARIVVFIGRFQVLGFNMRRNMKKKKVIGLLWKFQNIRRTVFRFQIEL